MTLVPPEFRLTVLKPKGSGQARKHIYKDGTIREADQNLKYFFHSTEDISTPETLLAVLKRLSTQNVAIIRGEPACSRQPLHRQEAYVADRGDEGFVDVPRRWITFDVDGLTLPCLTDWRDDLDAVIEHAVGLLPEVFQDAKIVWQLTTSHGLETVSVKNGRRWTGNYLGDKARLRLWALLDTPISSRQAVTWTKIMSGPLALDVSVSRTVQMNFVARPSSETGLDPLHPFIAMGMPVVGMRDGLDDYVSVPQIEEEVRRAKASGRVLQCASHPSYEEAILSIGKPTVLDGRGEVRSHLWAAARHLIRQQRKDGRELVAADLAATIRAHVMEQRDAIETNLDAHGRRWGDVTKYLSRDIEDICTWQIAQPEPKRGGDGGGKRKIAEFVPSHSLKTDPSINVLTIPQIRDVCQSTIHEFIQRDALDYWKAVAAYYPVITDEYGNPTVPHPVPPRRMLAVSTGVGKSGDIIAGALDYIAADRAAGGTKAAVLAVPHHDLADELLERVTVQAAKSGRQIKAAVWKGMGQPDPVWPSETMCRRPADLEIVHTFKLPVSTTLCASGSGENRTECKLAALCGYKRQIRGAADADIIILTHSLLTQRLPSALPEAGILFVDEAAWQIMAGGCDTPVKISATALRKAGKNTPDLDWAKRRLAELLDGPTPEPDGGIRAELLQALRQTMGAMGITPADAAKLEWNSAAKLGLNVVDYSGADLEAALKRELGDASGIKAARQMASLWRAVDDAQHLPAGTRSGRLEIFTPKGEDAVREIRVRWKEELAEGWSKVPILLADATADATVLQACFDGITPSPRYVSHSPFVRIRQIVDRSMSHAAIAPKSEEELAKASESQKANAKTARSNAQKVKAKLIADALHRYQGQPVVAVVPAATEKVWREGTIPSWLSILHHGATTGLDGHGNSRAVYVVGRALPPSSAVEAYAGTLTGIEPAQRGYKEVKRELVCADGSGVIVDAWEHPDPLCEAIRRQITEAGIIQAAGRGRGINRTEATPLDLILWTDVAVPELGLVAAETWEAPSIEAEMLAAGVWIDFPSDAAKVHPELISSPDSLRKQRQRLRLDISLWETSISKCPSSWRYRPATEKRAALGKAVFLNDLSESEARAYLEARLGPLAVLERVPPASDLSEALQTPLAATQEGAGAAYAMEEAQTYPVPNLGESRAIQPDLPPLPAVEDDLAAYKGGIMPPHIRVQSRALQSALGLTQGGFAGLIGISRPQLANAQQGRFGLSEAAAARLVHLLRQPPQIKQPDLFNAIQ